MCVMARCWFRISLERCTAAVFGTTLVMAVCAPDFGKDLEMYEAFISSVTKVLREGRRGGAREFYITGDLNVELGLMCTDEKDIEELNEMHGTLCWQGYEKRQWRFQEADVVWNHEGDQLQGCIHVVRVRPSQRYYFHTQTTQRQEAGMEGAAGLHYIVGPRCKADEAHINKDVKIWDSWDHYQIYASMQEDEIAKYGFSARRRKKVVDRMEAKDRCVKH